MADMVFITGASDRVGVSIVAGLLMLHGARFGTLHKLEYHDGRCAFENRTIRNATALPLLKEVGADIHGQCILPETNDCIAKAHALGGQWRDTVLKETGNDSVRPIAYASAHACLVWPVWYAAFPEAKWIILQRETRDLTRSCMKTRYMRGRNAEPEWYDWIDKHLEKYAEMKEARLQTGDLWLRTMFSKGDMSHLKAVVEWAGLVWNGATAKEYIKPMLSDKAKAAMKEGA